MRFSVSAVAAVLAMATSVIAQNPTKDFDPVTKPTKQEKIPAGSTYTVEWTTPDKYADDTISISLIGGASQDSQVPLSQVAAGVDNSAGSYKWSVPSDLGDKAVYGLVFTLESNPEVFQYSNPFHITAGSGSGSSSGSSSDDSTTTVTKSSGIKTVTLSTTSTTPTSASTTSMESSTSTSMSTTMNNTSMVTKPTQTVVTSTKMVGSTSGSATTTSAEPTHTNAAGRVGASSVALVGAMAMAYFAL